MRELAGKQQRSEYEYKKRQHVCHDAEQTVAKVMDLHAEGSGSIHDYCKEKEDADRKQSDAPDDVVIASVPGASALHLLEDFLFGRIARI